MPYFHPVFSVFLFFWIIRVYFLIAHFFKLIKYQPPTPSKEANNPVSVIICAHNEYQNLKNQLKSILEQDYADFEVIVVNDRSSDSTDELLLTYQENYPHLKLITIKGVAEGTNPKKNALTIGIQAAKNEIILLTDADCSVTSKHWIAKMAQCYKNNTEIVLGVSMYKKTSNFLNQFIQFETIQTAALYLSAALKRKPYMGLGRNLSYKKSFFLKNNGFNQYLSVTGGDDDLFVNKHATKLNTEICIAPEAITYSEPKVKLSDYLIQKTRHLSVGKYYSKKDQIILGLYHFSQTMLWIFFIFGLYLFNLPVLLTSLLLMIVFWIGQYVVFSKLSINFGAKIKLRWLPILEIFFIFYYWCLGAYALLSKKVKWK
jgi:hypothetical protein